MVITDNLEISLAVPGIYEHPKDGVASRKFDYPLVHLANIIGKDGHTFFFHRSANVLKWFMICPVKFESSPARDRI